MQKTAFLLLAAMAIALPSLGATYLKIQGPVNETLGYNGTVYLGKVGPGESFYVLANASTTNSTGTFINIGWDTLRTVNLPQGWSSQPSPLYENPMRLKITVSPNQQSGIQMITLRAVNVGNYSKLGNLTVYADVNVTTNVFTVNVTPTTFRTGIGQPVNIKITINNTGISDDPFIISASNLPAWNLSDEVISIHSTSSTFVYPVFQNEPGSYPFNITVSSATSPLIRKSYQLNMVVKESLSNDYNAIGNGVIVSPILFEPAYVFMSVLSNLYKFLVH